MAKAAKDPTVKKLDQLERRLEKNMDALDSGKITTAQARAETRAVRKETAKINKEIREKAKSLRGK